ncbi:MAG TPA: ABC transporter permease [Atribacterota bacterium]|nr:ABC transporter permease [Atribacterota bacterium]
MKPLEKDITKNNRKSFFKDTIRRLLKNKGALIGLIILFIMIVLAIFANIISPFDPLDFNIKDRFIAPSSKYLLGTDNYGRDILSRAIFGARISLTVSLIVVLFTGFFGILIGIVAGYFPKVDSIIMRIMDTLMAFPSILLGITIVAVLGTSGFNAAIALGIVYTPRMARIVRGAVLQTKNCEYVNAAKALGANNYRILLRHILPNCLAPIIIQSSFIFAAAVLGEAALSFIGAGTPPPTPSWGNILSEGREFMRIAPWITIVPGIFIAVTVFAINIVGDSLRDLLDPRLRNII